MHGPRAQSSTVVVGTAHLESGEGNSAMRARQLAAAFRSSAFTSAAAGAAAGVVLAGDFNWMFRDDELVLPAGYADAWRIAVGAGTRAGPGYTFDGRANKMCVGKYRDRLDRVVYRRGGSGGGGGMRLLDCAMVGTRPLPAAAATAGGSGGGGVMRRTRDFGGGEGTRDVPVYISDHFGLLASWTFG